MLYVITHLKAPWPHGAVVGDVLDLEEVPAWALGKCKPAEEGAEASLIDATSDSGPAFISNTSASEESKAATALAEAEAQAAQEKSAIEGKGKKHK